MTTDRAVDDDLCEHVRSHSESKIFRGNYLDVGQRFLDCIDEAKVDFVFRLTADNPFAPLEVITSLIAEPDIADYASTKLGTGYPIGTDVEFFSSEAFRRARSENFLSAYEREHVTPMFYASPPRLSNVKVRAIRRETDALTAARLTIDTPNDFRLLREKSHDILSKGVSAAWQDLAKIMLESQSTGQSHTP